MASTEFFNADRGFPAQKLQELLDAIDPFPQGELSTPEVRDVWRERLGSRGWLPDYIIPESRLRISLWKDNFGVCVQFGNTARVNSDMLKLQTLFILGRIEAGALIVPTNTYSRFLGSNHASVATTTRDLRVFDVAITVPVVVVGVEP